MRFAVLALILSGCAVADAPERFPVESPSAAVAEGVLVESVGLRTLGGVFTPILAEGCATPCERTQTFSTAADGQTEIALFLYRGLSGLAKDAHSLGEFKIQAIREAPRGDPLIKVTFRADADGISISADGGPGENVRILRAAE